MAGDPIRYAFADGSALVETGGAWDFEGDALFTWRGGESSAGRFRFDEHSGSLYRYSAEHGAYVHIGKSPDSRTLGEALAELREEDY